MKQDEEPCEELVQQAGCWASVSCMALRAAEFLGGQDVSASLAHHGLHLL